MTTGRINQVAHETRGGRRLTTAKGACRLPPRARTSPARRNTNGRPHADTTNKWTVSREDRPNETQLATDSPTVLTRRTAPTERAPIHECCQLHKAGKCSRLGPGARAGAPVANGSRGARPHGSHAHPAKAQASTRGVFPMLSAQPRIAPTQANPIQHTSDLLRTTRRWCGSHARGGAADTGGAADGARAPRLSHKE